MKNILLLLFFVVSMTSCQTDAEAVSNRIIYLEYENIEIKVEYLMIPLIKDGEKIFLEAELYTNGDLDTYWGVVTTHADKLDIDYSNLNMAFASKGAAVLYVVRAGYGASEGDRPDTSLSLEEIGLESAADLVAGVNYLKNIDSINPDNITILGHGNGGWASIAASSFDIDGLKNTINIGGYPETEEMNQISLEDKQNWITACNSFGAISIRKSIWIYSSNDSKVDMMTMFQMVDAYSSSGGDVLLNLLGDYGSEGNNLVEEPELFVDFVLDMLDQ